MARIEYELGGASRSKALVSGRHLYRGQFAAGSMCRAAMFIGGVEQQGECSVILVRGQQETWVANPSSIGLESPGTEVQSPAQSVQTLGKIIER